MIQEQATAIVRDFENRYASAFNRRDISAFVELFSEDVTIVTEWGDVVEGRADFARGLERAFAVVPSEVQIENKPSHVVALTTDVIISHGTSHKRSGEGLEQLVYTRVLVRQGEQWRLAANHVAEPSKRADPRV